jgi:hypothetical protein
MHEIKKRGAGGTYWTKMYTDFWLETLEENDRFEDLGADRIILLKWIKKQDVKA